MNIYILRLGETKLNEERRLQGQRDFPLNEAGRRQALQAGERIKELGFSFDVVYSSPLKRAVETAVLVTGRPEEELRIDKRIIEMDYGPFEGKSYREVDESMMDFFRDPVHVKAPEGMEQMDDLAARVSDFFRMLEEEQPAENILVVTHGVAIRAMMPHIKKESAEEAWKLMVGNCDLFHTVFADGAYTKPVQYRLLREPTDGSLQ